MSRQVEDKNTRMTDLLALTPNRLTPPSATVSGHFMAGVWPTAAEAMMPRAQWTSEGTDRGEVQA